MVPDTALAALAGSPTAAAVLQLQEVLGDTPPPCGIRSACRTVLPALGRRREVQSGEGGCSAAAVQRETDAAGAGLVADAASSTERARKVDPATAAGIAMIAPNGTMKQSCVAMPKP